MQSYFYGRVLVVLLIVLDVGSVQDFYFLSCYIF
nr:MAG TPA: hypothetical protein [Bacteriophage sp.]